MKRRIKRRDIKFLMNLHEQLGHMTRISEILVFSPHLYLPHHTITKETSITTNVRVVFNRSAKDSTDISLKDTQYVGPKIQHDLFSILLRFRNHDFVTTDIAKIYYEVLVKNNQKIFTINIMS